MAEEEEALAKTAPEPTELTQHVLKSWLSAMVAQDEFELEDLLISELDQPEASKREREAFIHARTNLPAWVEALPETTGVESVGEPNHMGSKHGLHLWLYECSLKGAKASVPVQVFVMEGKTWSKVVIPVRARPSS